MPTARKSALVPQSCATLFGLVDDVERYPEFLPWCASTEVLERESLHRIVLEVRLRPTGTARVELSADAFDGGTVVTMEETLESGPVRWLPRLVTDPALHARNALSLQRLRHEVERRARPAP